jgi:hypothetical protein
MENVFDESIVKLQPVMAVPAIGLQPMFPVMADEGTVVMPDAVRIAKSPALPSSTFLWGGRGVAGKGRRELKGGPAVAVAVASTMAAKMHLKTAPMLCVTKTGNVFTV